MIKTINKNIRVLRENGFAVILNPDNNSWVRMKMEFYEKNISNILDNTNVLTKALHKYNILQDKEISINNFTTVYFALTNKCNLNCSYCSMSSSPLERVPSRFFRKFISRLVDIS
jgi:sulfatase maturation enzyme AslB (radical SAM superfamily)